MTYFKNKDYLELLKDLTDQQYNDTIDDIEDMEWIPAESPAKNKIINSQNQAIIDLTNIKSNLIKDEILKYTNFKIGSFRTRIRRYLQQPSQNGAIMSIDLEIWEHQTKTPSGNPCNMDFPINMLQDNRFDKRPWLKYFVKNVAYSVPIDDAIEIIRWLQGIHRLTAFL